MYAAVKKTHAGKEWMRKANEHIDEYIVRGVRRECEEISKGEDVQKMPSRIASRMCEEGRGALIRNGQRHRQQKEEEKNKGEVMMTGRGRGRGGR